MLRSWFLIPLSDKRIQESLKKWLNQGLGQKINKMSLGHLTVLESEEVHKKPDIPHWVKKEHRYQLKELPMSKIGGKKFDQENKVVVNCNPKLKINIFESTVFPVSVGHAYMLNCFRCVWPFATPWTVTHQAPLFMGFSRQEYWSWLPYPPLGDLPNPGMQQTCFLCLLHWQVGSLPLVLPYSHYKQIMEYINNWKRTDKSTM